MSRNNEIGNGKQEMRGVSVKVSKGSSVNGLKLIPMC